MDSRERLRRCFHHEQIDRPGVFVRTGFPSNDPTYDKLKAYLNSHTELKPLWRAGELIAPHNVTRFTEPHSDDFERRVRILHTPAGDLRSSHLASLRGEPGLAGEYLLKTRQDAETYLSLPMPKIGGAIDGFFALDRQVGRRGIVDIALGLNPGGTTVELFGSETFAIMSVTDRDVVHAICRRHMDIQIELVKYLIEHEVGPFFSTLGQELLVPPLHGPKDCQDFNVQYDKPIIDLLHDAGGRVHVHCHGSIKLVFQGFLDMGADVLHPFEAPPMGDITPAEAKQLAGDRICLEGNLQIADMYEAAPDNIRRQTQELIAEAFGDRKNLIVCPTASPYIRGAGEESFENFKAMIDAVLEWAP